MLLTIAFRLAISEMLASKINMIIFDEPTNHMDSDSKDYLAETFSLVKEYLKIKDIQMIVATHEEKITNIADYVIEV